MDSVLLWNSHGDCRLRPATAPYPTSTPSKCPGHQWNGLDPCLSPKAARVLCPGPHSECMLPLLWAFSVLSPPTQDSFPALPFSSGHSHPRVRHRGIPYGPGSKPYCDLHPTTLQRRVFTAFFLKSASLSRGILIISVMQRVRLLYLKGNVVHPALIADVNNANVRRQRNG